MQQFEGFLTFKHLPLFQNRFNYKAGIPFKKADLKLRVNPFDFKYSSLIFFQKILEQNLYQSNLIIRLLF